MVERGATLGWRIAEQVIQFLPPAISTWAIATASRASYRLWPTKRRWSNANFGHILSLPPDHPRVRRTAERAYGAYARYLVDLMRLGSLDRAGAARLMDDASAREVERIWRGHGGPVILVLGHIGSADGAAVAIASHGWPLNAIADDSTFPELFEHLRAERARWGLRLVPWRNLRETYAVLRRNEILALLIDWGYRADGIPVKLGDAWTTVPAGPAVLAAKTGALIVPVAVRRLPGNRLAADIGEPIAVPSSSPADLARASQQSADALEAAILAAPDQWYSFKPLWPESPAEQAAHEARAAEMLADDGSGKRGAKARGAAGAATTLRNDGTERRRRDPLDEATAR